MRDRCNQWGFTGKDRISASAAHETAHCRQFFVCFLPQRLSISLRSWFNGNGIGFYRISRLQDHVPRFHHVAVHAEQQTAGAVVIVSRSLSISRLVIAARVTFLFENTMTFTTKVRNVRLLVPEQFLTFHWTMFTLCLQIAIFSYRACIYLTTRFRRSN